MKKLTSSKEANSLQEARPLSLEEIEALPFASVIWISSTSNDRGVCWHWKAPVVVGASGKYGMLVGETEGSIISREIDEKIADNPSEMYWTHEPDDSQIPGITEAEFNNDPDQDNIVCEQLAEAITGRKVTFRGICEQTGIDLREFMEAMNGKRDFSCGELAAIANSLNTTVDEILPPERVAQI